MAIDAGDTLRRARKKATRFARFALLPVLCGVGSAGCNSVLGLNDLTISETTGSGGAGGDGGGVPHECDTNQQCIDRFTASDGGTGPDDGVVAAVCVKPAYKCAPLRSQDCATVTGDFRNDNAIVIGSIFQTTGAQSATNLARQKSAMMAVNLVNEAGGVPAGDSSHKGRPLVLVSCDGSADLVRAGNHLASDLGVPAIVGPNNSQDTLDLSSKVTIEKGTVLLTPTAVASSITALLDDDLTWLMAPSDVQRAVMMIQQLGELEKQLKAERGVDAIKLGVAFRNDALGIGTRTSLNELVLNGRSLVDSINSGSVRIDPYDPAAANQDAVVAGQIAHAPDIVVLAGTAESITRVMQPLEAGWNAEKPRPHYILIDPAKVPELLTVAENGDLRSRIRGTGAVSGPSSKSVYDAFRIEYGVRYPGETATTSGMGPSHDAVFAIAFALAASAGEPVSGHAVARGLRKLAGGETTVLAQSTQIRSAFQALAGGNKISAIGTFCPFDWDANGAVKGGTLEVWCIGQSNGKPAFGSSGLTYDLAKGEYAGEFKACGQ